MGLFSSSISYQAYAASSSMFAEDERPDTVMSLLLQAVIGGDATLSEAIKLGLQTNLYARSESMIKYAEREYIYGLPETSHISIHIDNAIIKDTIETVIGEPIRLLHVGWGQFNPQFHIEKAINDSYMDPVYFPWPAGDPLNTDWEARDDQQEIPVVDPLGGYYFTDNQLRYSQSGNNFYGIFDYITDAGVVSWTTAASYDFSQYMTTNWVWVRYETLSNTGVTVYWLYKVGSNEIPSLEEQIETDSLQMQYLPVAIMMHDKVWYDDSIAGDEDLLEVTTNRLIKKLSLKGDKVKEDFLLQQEEAVASGEGTGNANIWDFFIHFAVPIRSTYRGSREYIYHFLLFLENIAQWTTYDEYQTFLAAGGTGAQPTSNFHIREGGSEAYHVWYRWSYIHAVTYDGQYMLDGVPMEAKQSTSSIYEFGTAGYETGIREVHGPEALIATSETEGTDGIYHDYAVFTMQHQNDNDGSYTYTQVIIMAPSMMYVINVVEDGSRELYTPVELFPEDLDEISEWRFPIHIGSLTEVPTMHREEMLADALAGTVFLVEQIKVKWYQKTFFKWLIVIIVIIIVVVFWQFELLPKLAAMAAAATGAVAASLWLLYVALTFALGFVISFAGSLIGGKFGLLFTIVATLILAGTNPFTNLRDSFSKFVTQTSWGSAITLIQASKPFMNFGIAVVQDIQLAKLESDMRDFTKSAQEKQQELQDAWDAFGPTPKWLDPADLIKVQSKTVVESSDSFIERTLNANPGILGYDLISRFTEIALILPENVGEDNIITNVFETFERQRGAA